MRYSLTWTLSVVGIAILTLGIGTATADTRRALAFQKTGAKQFLMGRIIIATADTTDHRVKSDTFEEFAVVHMNDRDPVGRQWSARRPETREDRLFGAVIPDGMMEFGPEKCLIAFRDYNGFEGIPYVFAVWEAKGDSLVFQEFLDHYILVSMSTLKIDEIVPVSSTESVLRGSAQGGDAGDIIGCLWFAYWRHPRSLPVIYRKDWQRESFEPDVEVRLTHTLDKQTLELEVQLQERHVMNWDRREVAGTEQGPHYSGWQTRAVDFVDLGHLAHRGGGPR